MELYSYFRSSASFRVRIALGLKGLPYDYRAVHLVKKEQLAPEFAAMAPAQLVPVLKDGDALLTQSLAIIAYLDETRPARPLLPDHPSDRAQARALALAVACDIHPLSNLRVLERVEALAGAEARTAWNADNIASGLAAVERLLERVRGGRFAMGDAPGLVECALLPQLYNARRWGVPIDGWPHLSRIAANADGDSRLAAAHPDRAREMAAARATTD